MIFHLLEIEMHQKYITLWFNYPWVLTNYEDLIRAVVQLSDDKLFHENYAFSLQICKKNSSNSLQNIP